jgi:hypothetical protein
MTLADSGNLDGAEAAGREFAKNVDRHAILHIGAVRRRLRVHGLAVWALAVTLGVAALSIVAAGHLAVGALTAVRRLAPSVAAFLSYAGLTGGYLASTYENGTPFPFLWFAAFMLPLALIFRGWSAVGSPDLASRAGRAVLAVAATMALGFLVVESIDTTFLAGFGL